MSDSTLPPGWTKSNGLYMHDHPRMYVRRAAPRRKWWATAKLDGVEWHSFDHKTAEDAMLAAGTLAALLGALAEAEKRGMERERARYADLMTALAGLMCGEDWNHGTHAQRHGYRAAVMRAYAAICAPAEGETP